MEMHKISNDPFPWVVDKTKSGGLRLIIFLKRPIDAEVVRKVMLIKAAQLGYSGNEIFPKQSKLAEKDDCPSWTFLPLVPHSISLLISVG
jgi:hypothetical protein